MSSPIWFITGCSSGFGASLAIKALKAGHRVVASSRNISKSPELVTEVRSLGGHWLEFDVCSTNLRDDIAKVLGVYGYIDVLVNNAGISMIGAVEDITAEDDRKLMDTNYFAPLNIIRLVLPSMRKRKSGTIVNISSSAGVVALPACGAYAASKHALEGMTEALSQELVPFNIRTLLIEPGGFRTSFITNSARPAPSSTISSIYNDTAAGKILSMLDAMDGKQLGDPAKASQAIFDIVTKTGVAKDVKEDFLRFPLGSDCANRIKEKLERGLKTLEETKDVWESTDSKADDTIVVDKQ